MAKKILLADDSITIQKVVELTFSDGDFEVVAVNNGARAIQQLQESRPDIILSDIIMPEKNGYEVCEFVKSHPDYKTIPVVLLTGTFEPFDPDRAERAGCDAVVTKPFESQSLIHKVEELIAAAGPAAPSAPEASPFDETAVERRPSREMAFEPPPQDGEPAEPPSAEDAQASSPETPAGDPFGETGQPTPDEIFGLSSGSPDSSESPDSSARSPFDETNPPFPSTPPEPDPSTGWPSAKAPDEAAQDFGAQDVPQTSSPDEARDLEPPSVPASGFGDVSESDEEAAPAEPPAGEEVWSAATTAFPKMSFDDLRKAAEQNEAAPAPPETDDSAWSAETTAIPKMTFDDLPKPPEPTAEPEPSAETSLPWETSSAPESHEDVPAWPSSPPPVEEPAEQPVSSFGFDTPTPGDESIPHEPSAGQEGGSAWPSPSIESETPVADDSAFATPEPMESGTGDESEAVAEEQETAPAAPSGGALSDADVDRIARRVVELLSDRTVREIAWEVIPDIANGIVRDRIRELETSD